MAESWESKERADQRALVGRLAAMYHLGMQITTLARIIGVELEGDHWNLEVRVPSGALVSFMSLCLPTFAHYGSLDLVWSQHTCIQNMKSQVQTSSTSNPRHQHLSHHHITLAARK